MIKKFCFLVLIATLVSCTKWPMPSTGGYAQHYFFTPLFQARIYRHPCSCPLARRYKRMVLEFQALQLSHAKRCQPARFTLMALLIQRIPQEIARNLCQAADYDLILFAKNLRIVQQLNLHKSCVRRPARSTSWDLLKARST